MSAPVLSSPSTPATGLNAERFAAHLAQQAPLPAWWLDAKQVAW